MRISMAKMKEVFFCSECGYESAKWMGQCPACKQWNTFAEEKITISTSKGSQGKSVSKNYKAPQPMKEIKVTNTNWIHTKIGELDRVLGGGIVRGSLVLVGGDPGIGKSTLLLQMCGNLSESGHKILYVSGEESESQIKLRADRLGEFTKELYLLCEIHLEQIEEAILKLKPEVVVIDSIQTMLSSESDSAQGSVSQVREVTAKLMQLAKQEEVAIFVVGHVTKEGTVAGPKTLEHMVDTVLYFEGDRYGSYRMLRGVKNRFGSTNEMGVFEMVGTGLLEVTNPSKVMLEGKPKEASGSVVTCTMEGTRPILLEVQALCTQTNFNMPRRTAVGIDYNRVNLLIAVIEKRLHLQLGGCDAYVNIAGGIKVNEPAVDLAIILALISSYKNRSLSEDTIVFGEVGLTGEVRAVNMVEQRIKEAEKLGFTTCILPKANLRHQKENGNLKCIGVEHIHEVLDYIS